MAKRQASLLGFMQATSKRQKESEDNIDENVDLQEPETHMESSEVNVSFVYGAQCCANCDIVYHKEYLDELDLTLVAKEFAEKFDRISALVFNFFVCANTFILLIIKLFTHCSVPPNFRSCHSYLHGLLARPRIRGALTFFAHADKI